MVKVVQRGRFSIYVYPESGQPHHFAHCHVYWADGEAVVDLAKLLVLSGDRLPVPAQELLREHLAEIKRLDPVEPWEADRMTATTPATRRWETRAYARIVSARFLAPTLFVGFADGSEVGVDVERFDIPTIRSQTPDWSRARASVHEIVVPTAADEVGIPWDSIRALTDAEFAAHWAEMASRIARDIGARVRGWREEQRLDPAALAYRAGVPIETVTGVEAGRHGVDVDLLDRLLAALGRDASDLIDESGFDPT